MVRSRHLSLTVAMLCALAALGVLLFPGSEAWGSLITGVGTADLVTGGQYDGWYKYTITVDWSLTRGLSHLDLILPPATCGDFQIAFDTDIGGTQDGRSTGSTYKPGDTVSYTVPLAGAFSSKGDPSIKGLTSPLVKWEPSTSKNPGKVGTGQFWFYSNYAPSYGTQENVLTAKYGTSSLTGTLSGAYVSDHLTPSPVPEPATLAFFGVGAAMLYASRRRKARRA